MATRNEEGHNTLTLIGRLSRDPNLAATTGGVSCLNMVVAVSTSYGQDRLQRTRFIPVTMWNAKRIGHLADILRKGMKLLITGEIHESEGKLSVNAQGLLIL